MKLGEAIKNKDYSLFEESTPTFYNYYDNFSSILYPDGYLIDYDHHDAVEKTGRVKRYAVREWLCTDTHVGLYLYLVDDEPVCLMYQRGRKSYPEWTFVSEEATRKTKVLFDECKPLNEYKATGVDKDFLADLLELIIDDKLFGDSITNEQIGLSPLLTYEYLIDVTKKNLEEYQKEAIRGVLREEVDTHEKLLEMIKERGSAKDVERFLSKSQHIYEFATDFLAS